MRFDRIEDALNALCKGEMILVADDESRETREIWSARRRRLHRRSSTSW